MDIIFLVLLKNGQGTNGPIESSPPGQTNNKLVGLFIDYLALLNIGSRLL